MTSATLNRRLLLGAALLVGSSGAACAQSRQPRDLVVYKTPTCPCCDGWIAHIEDAGFPVRVVESTDMDSFKQRLGVPAELASCHTAEVDGYVIEGHVPAAAIRRLLVERPDATGLAVPGMPAGSPGMDFPGVDPEPYEAFLFGPTTRSFGRFLGSREI